MKLERNAVHTIPQARWRGPVRKNMAQMRRAGVAVHLCPGGKPRIVNAFTNWSSDHGLRKRRPSRAAVEFVIC